nr:MAG TPA: hypothetical protein [Microviridae sp.]
MSVRQVPNKAGTWRTSYIIFVVVVVVEHVEKLNSTILQRR